jgi:DNA mismatch repair protein MSH3
MFRFTSFQFISPFSRYVDTIDSVDMLESTSPAPFLCIVEDKKGSKETEVNVALISVCPSTGDVVYDEFEDSLMRLELEVQQVFFLES